MNIDKIVSDLVEKRFDDLLHTIIADGMRDSGFNLNHDVLYQMFRKKVEGVIAQELEKRDEQIRASVNQAITDAVAAHQIEIHFSPRRSL